MRLLLDEMLPRNLARLFAPEMEAVTVRRRGWAAKKNGELLAAAQGEFDALLTMDRSLPHQQNLGDVDLVIVLLEARSNRLEDLSPLVEGAKSALSGARRGELVRVLAPYSLPVPPGDRFVETAVMLTGSPAFPFRRGP